MRRCFWTLLSLATSVAVSSGPVSGQVVGQEDAVLQGIAAVDAQVSVTWKDAITKDGGPTETQYQQDYLGAFRSVLSQGGLQISDEAPNYLFCSIALVYDSDTGVVSAAQTVEYHEPMGPENQWAITWMLSQVYTVGLQNFGGADDAQWCGTRFVESWRSGNGGA